MRSALIVLAVAAPAMLTAQGETTAFSPGMVVTASSRITPGSYLVPETVRPAITIRGDGIDLDLTGVELIGDVQRDAPDHFVGNGIVVKAGSRVTVRGATVRGFRVGIAARGTSGLRLLDNDLSHNWKPRLHSRIERESLIDWMSFHHNDSSEWRSRGAGIQLEDVLGGELKGNRVRQGASGVLITRSDSLLIWNNDFSYNSALGIGMYRSSHNTIMHNRIDYNVRGYSHGFYNRGQDSAGLLMYEQSCHNLVAFNSVTHSGDGLFIWAGQSTMDSGEGGVNDNLFFGNDFSHAPTNGIENTFSRNVFVNNRVEENWHGVWGGYSWQTVFIGNRFIDNDEAITIEHGQEIRIVGNSFDGDTTAIRIWQNPTEPADWGYPKNRDTRSRDYVILGNSFSDVGTAIQATDSRNVRIDGNLFSDVDTVIKTEGDTTGWSFSPSATGRPAPVPVPAEFRVRPRRGGIDPMIPGGSPRGRRTIIVDEWGPYDWLSPKLWPVGRGDDSPQRLRILGPPGDWHLLSLDGIVSVSAESGRIGDTLVVVPTRGREDDYRVEVGYVGEQVTSRFGELHEPGDTVGFAWQRFRPEIEWRLDFVPLQDVADSMRLDALNQAVPVASIDTTGLDLIWYRPPSADIPQANLLTLATGMVDLTPGRYLLRTIADDAVRLFVDDQPVLDDWNPGESHMMEVEFEATGRHKISIQHLQLDGWYELRLDIERVQ